MYLDKILGTETKLNILSKLVSNPDKKFVERELAKEVRMAPSGVNRQIKDLVECGLVKFEKVGRTNYYKINEKHFLFPALKELFKDLNQAYIQLAKNITKCVVRKHKIKAVILVGSAKDRTVREDYVKEPSDLDLVVVGDNPNEILDDVLKCSFNLFEKYGINCYPIVLSERDYVKRLKENDPFILYVHVEGELLHGKKPGRFN